MEFGKRLVELRKKNNMTQEELALEVNVTRQTISNWELGSTKPDVEQLKELSRLYGISIDELVGNDTHNVLNVKMSNVEKLAGLIYNLLKWFIILFFGFWLFVMVLGLLFFGVRRTSEVIHSRSDTTMECWLDDELYPVWLWQENEERVNIDGMDDLLDNLIIDDYNDMQYIATVIKQYFHGRGGTCGH